MVMEITIRRMLITTKIMTIIKMMFAGPKH
jgi:hypothetical protein